MAERDLPDRALGWAEEEGPVSAVLRLAKMIEDLDRRVQELEQVVPSPETHDSGAYVRKGI
jgi:uncharacterized protein YecT (DUF1311 family)